MQKLVILGSTGSIGKSALEVVELNRDKFEIFALVCGKNYELLAKQCLAFQPKFAVVENCEIAEKLKILLENSKLDTVILSGIDAMCEIVQMPQVSTVLAGIVGTAGLKPSLFALKAGKKLLLANKEALVSSGQIFIEMAKANKAQIIPVDSEHSAIFQCLPKACQYEIGFCNLEKYGINKILLTGSGGPFLNLQTSELAKVTVKDALKHPNWSMGAKISIDSATMMNKGLEFIEAYFLFNCNFDQLKILVHPESIIHSMVQFKDGSTIAQLGNPSMQTPIAYALSYPDRIASGVDDLDFTKIVNLTFQEPDFKKFPNLKLAIDACKQGQFYTTILNASNEIAVEAFLQNKIKFTDIFTVNAKVLDSLCEFAITDLDTALEADQKARAKASFLI